MRLSVRLSLKVIIVPGFQVSPREHQIDQRLIYSFRSTTASAAELIPQSYTGLPLTIR